MASRIANSVNDVWERLETVKGFVKSRRQIDLSKRDIEFLLEYRDNVEVYRKDLEKKTADVECIKQILQIMVSMYRICYRVFIHLLLFFRNL